MLGPEAVKEYLEYLALERKVSASTQNQALDVDFAHNQIMVRNGKGQKDRVTILPQRFQPALREYLAQGFGAVYLWLALERKYPSAVRDR